MQLLISTAPWDGPSGEMGRLRREVFIDEQQVPESLEWDEVDAEAIQFLVRLQDNTLVATARLTADGHVGRVAVRKEWRRRGIGSRLMAWIADYARERGFPPLWFDAQVEAIPFYERLGYRAEGETFMDAGIPHKRMRSVSGSG